VVPVAPGRWGFAVALADVFGTRIYDADVAVELTVTTKRTVARERAAVHVHVVYVDGIDEDEDLVPGVEGALALGKDHAPEALGSPLVVRTSVASAALGTTALSNDSLAQLSALARPGEITMLVGADLPGTDEFQLYGEAGAIPGPQAPGPNSGIIIAARSVAGRDGRLDDEETEVLAQVMLHELGHYLGLKRIGRTGHLSQPGARDRGRRHRLKRRREQGWSVEMQSAARAPPAAGCRCATACPRACPCWAGCRGSPSRPRGRRGSGRGRPSSARCRRARRPRNKGRPCRRCLSRRRGTGRRARPSGHPAWRQSAAWAMRSVHKSPR
jgi:hypothetical protein